MEGSDSGSGKATYRVLVRVHLWKVKWIAFYNT